MKRLLAALATFGLLSLVACSADAGEGPGSAPQLAAATDCGSPTPTETPSETPSETPTSTPTETEPPTPLKVIGMSAPSNLWSQRLAEVGSCGVEARRIFADLTSNGRDQSAPIAQAISQGMMVVVSYKVPSVATFNSGGYDTWLDNLNTYLAGLDVPVAASFWHEPRGDMTGPEFRAGSQRFLDHVTAANVSVGPILNGFLLDTAGGTAEFATFTSPALLDQWDWIGVDSYQNGSTASPGTKMPARAVPLLATWLDGHGQPDKPIVVGEFNGFTSQAITTAGETLLSTPELWAGLVWNSSGGLGTPLTGARLQAFKDVKADARALHDPACLT